MTNYIALLRGINVGGKNRLKMAELKQALETIGLNRVQTYIQSGNVLFESEEDPDLLSNRIENAIETAFGMKVPTVLRTAPELERIIEHCPFSLAEIEAAEASSGAESLYVSFMHTAPTEEAVMRLSNLANENESYRIVGRDVYLLFRQSIRNSKLASHLPKLGDRATVRNWNTISKLSTMAAAMKV